MDGADRMVGPYIRIMTHILSMGTVPVASGSKTALNVRLWSVRSWISLEKEPSFLMVISCWKICRATAKLEDRECSTLAIGFYP
jgi:hypothetical protein